MASLDDLAYSSSLAPAELLHWGDLVQRGSGFTRISIPQKRRRRREILRPSVGLDRVLKQLSRGLQLSSSFSPHPAVHGFVRRRDIATNASQHLGRDVLLRIDLRDFFASIDGAIVVESLRAHGFDDGAASAVVGVAIVDGGLAQGFSTSPILSNMAFDATDFVISSLVQDRGVTYTRYVDDLTFSGATAVVNDELLEIVATSLRSCGWAVNPGKTRFMRRGRPQYVTGLFVGDPAGPHIPRSMKRLLRREVYYARRFGLEDARLRSPTPIPQDRLNGWVHYAAHVDPVFGESLRQHWGQVATRNSQGVDRLRWEEILDDIGFPETW